MNTDFEYRGHVFVRHVDGVHMVIGLPSHAAPEDWNEIQALAQSFDGHAEIGAFEDCAVVAAGVRAAFYDTGKVEGTVTEVRAALYFLQRAQRHMGWPPTEHEMAYPRAIVAELTARLGADWIKERAR